MTSTKPSVEPSSSSVSASASPWWSSGTLQEMIRLHGEMNLLDLWPITSYILTNFVLCQDQADTPFYQETEADSVVVHLLWGRRVARLMMFFYVAWLIGPLSDGGWLKLESMTHTGQSAASLCFVSRSLWRCPWCWRNIASLSYLHLYSLNHQYWIISYLYRSLYTL